MEMRVETLIPRMQDHNAAELPAEVVVAELEQRLARGGEQARNELPFIAEEEGVEVVREGKHGVKVWHGEEFGLTGFDPLGRGEALTLRTMPIAAGVVDRALEAALETLLAVATQLGRATGRDGL